MALGLALIPLTDGIQRAALAIGQLATHLLITHWTISEVLHALQQEQKGQRTEGGASSKWTGVTLACGLINGHRKAECSLFIRTLLQFKTITALLSQECLRERARKVKSRAEVQQCPLLADLQMYSYWRRRCTFCRHTTGTRWCWLYSWHSLRSGSSAHPLWLEDRDSLFTELEILHYNWYLNVKKKSAFLTRFRGAKWGMGDASIGCDWFPGEAATSAPDTADPWPGRHTSFLCQESLTAGRPVHKHIIKQHTREAPKDVHGPGEEQWRRWDITYTFLLLLFYFPKELINPIQNSST